MSSSALIGGVVTHWYDSRPIPKPIVDTRGYLIDRRARIRNGRAETEKLRLVDMRGSTNAFDDNDTCYATLKMVEERGRLSASQDKLSCENLTDEEARAIPRPAPYDDAYVQHR